MATHCEDGCCSSLSGRSGQRCPLGQSSFRPQSSTGGETMCDDVVGPSTGNSATCSQHCICLARICQVRLKQACWARTVDVHRRSSGIHPHRRVRVIENALPCRASADNANASRAWLAGICRDGAVAGYARRASLTAAAAPRAVAAWSPCSSEAASCVNSVAEGAGGAAVAAPGRKPRLTCGLHNDVDGRNCFHSGDWGCVMISGGASRTRLLAGIASVKRASHTGTAGQGQFVISGEAARGQCRTEVLQPGHIEVTKVTELPYRSGVIEGACCASRQTDYRTEASQSEPQQDALNIANRLRAFGNHITSQGGASSSPRAPAGASGLMQLLLVARLLVTRSRGLPHGLHRPKVW